jgi:hypothetical protein
MTIYGHLSSIPTSIEVHPIHGGNMTDLATVKKGEVELKVKVEGGKLSIASIYDGKGVDGKVEVLVEADYFLDKLAEAIPGKLDDSVIALIKAALKA